MTQHTQYSHHTEHATHVYKGGGFFNSLFSWMGSSAGCCIGIIIAAAILGILIAIAESHS